MATAEAEEFKTKGNTAFEAGNTDEAIENYTKAIELDQTNHVYYSNRSAAYLKAGKAEEALTDAESCIKLNADFHKGYGRKGAALHALKRYADATAAYEEGLAKFPEDPVLTKGLQDVKRDEQVRRSSRTHRASIHAKASLQKRKSAASSLSQFVQYGRVNLEITIAALQAQLQLLNALADMTDEQKLKLLFGLLDKDGDGKINARELADALRKRNEDLNFVDSIESAINVVALFDVDKDAKLDLDEFKSFIDSMMTAMDATFHELSEFLILEHLFSDGGNNLAEEIVGTIASEEIDEAVKTTGEFYDALKDERMVALFRLFDTDGDGAVDFVEVAMGLFTLTKDMDASAAAAVDLLLMFDKDDSRDLDYVQFAKLIMNIAAASDTKFGEVADVMTLAMCQPTVITMDEIVHLAVAEEMYELASEIKEAQKDVVETIGALQYERLHRLFDLWDLDKDGFIDYQELLMGMRKFQEARDIDETMQQAAVVILGFDEDGDQKLDRPEFALAMVKYAQALEVELPELVDFLVVVSALKGNDAMETAYMAALAPAVSAEIKGLQEQLAALEM